MDLNDFIKSTADRDRQVSYEIAKSLNNKGLVAVITVFTELGSSLGAFVIFALVGLYSGLSALSLMVPIYLVQLGIVELVKIASKKPRPQAKIEELRETNIFGVKARSGSFPSGHASNIFAMAVLLSTYYNASTFVTGLLFTVAFLVSLSRIYLGKHYVVDVFAGALIGLLCSSLLLTLIKGI